MKIVVLEQESMGYDIDITCFEDFGEVTYYKNTAKDEVAQRVKDVDIIIANKAPLNKDTLQDADRLKIICEFATGYNNVDLDYCKERGIRVTNAVGYSTPVVAQHTFAMLFYLLEKLRYYDDYVKTERYVKDVSFTHFAKAFHELSGMTFGIIGLGNIGKRVADIAGMFGCRVIYYSTSGRHTQPGYTRVSLEKLLLESDIVSVHAPLTEQTMGLMNREAFRRMKPSAIFLNLGRGPIVVEQDLAEALREGQIAAAGLDVLSKEPMQPDNPLREIKDSERLLITPHIAWASVEARNRLMNTIAEQIRNFL